MTLLKTFSTEVRASSMKVMTKSKHNVGVAPNAKALTTVYAFAWTMTTRWIFCRVLSHELRVRTARTLWVLMIYLSRRREN